MTVLDPEAIFTSLAAHEVEYVLIGGLAAVLHGSPLPTLDADICPARTPENLARLAAALVELDARIRTSDTPGGVPFPRDAGFLASVDLLNLVTRAGDLDVAFLPAGGLDYTTLVTRVRPLRVREVTIPVADLEDVIRSKEAANRPKDQRTLPVLRQLLTEIRKRSRG
jgi:hypothetical protein